MSRREEDAWIPAGLDAGEKPHFGHEDETGAPAEALWQDGEERYQSFITASTDLIFIKDNQFRYVEVNEALKEYFGKPRDEILLQTDFDLMDRRCAENCRASDTAALQSNDVTVTIEEIAGRILETTKFPVPLQRGGTGIGGIIRDISDRVHKEEALRHRVEMESYLARFSTRCIHLPAEGLDAAILDVLQDIGSQTAVDRCYVFLLDESREMMDNTHEWCAAGIGPQQEMLQKLRCDIFPWWMDRLSRFETIHVPIVANLPAEATAEREILEAQSVQSVLVVPIVTKNVLRGFLGFDSVARERTWSGGDLQVLETVANTIGLVLERIETENALRESEGRYRTLYNEQQSLLAEVTQAHQKHMSHIENSPLAMIEWDNQFRVSYWSHQAEALFGWPAEEVLGRHPSEWRFLPEEDKPAVQGVMERLLLGIDPRNINSNRNYSREGSMLDCVWYNSALRDQDGKLASVYSLVLDVTAQMRLNRELQESEERFRMLIQNAPEGIYVQTDSDFAFLNPAALRMFGVKSLEKLLGKPVLGQVHPDHREIARRRTRNLIEQGQEVPAMELRFLKNDGTSFPVEVSAAPIRYDGRNGALVYFKDITERLRAEGELRKLSLAVEQSPSMVMITDPEDRIEYINPRFMEVTGYTLAELRGRTPHLLESDETPREVYDTLEATIRAGREWHGELYDRKKDGSGFWGHWAFSPIRDAMGDATHTLALGEDITQEKRLQQQLLQAQKMESVGRLAGGVAHDFNNMLTVILGNTDLALATLKADAPLYEDLKQIRSAAQRSADLTWQLLTFSRPEKARLEVLNLNNTMAGMLKMMGGLIGEDIDLVWKPGSNLWSVKMDPAQVDQVLSNLLINARDAIEDVGKVTIETKNVVVDNTFCESHIGTNPGLYVLLTVSDDGAGMDIATQEKIFEPFFTTKELGKGTGLGLSTVYGIVKQNGGFIDVLSKPGRGSTFKVYLPRVNGVEGEQEALREEPSLLGDETVLLVEDEEDIIKLGQRILAACGYTVLTALTPEEALRMGQEDTGVIHLLITDVVMPGMNGKEMAVRLEALRPGLKTLYMSGYMGDVIARHGVLDEGVQFLQKPFSITTLARRVRETLDSVD